MLITSYYDIVFLEYLEVIESDLLVIIFQNSNFLVCFQIDHMDFIVRHCEDVLLCHLDFIRV